MAAAQFSRGLLKNRSFFALQIYIKISLLLFLVLLISGLERTFIDVREDLSKICTSVSFLFCSVVVYAAGYLTLSAPTGGRRLARPPPRDPDPVCRSSDQYL